MVHSIIISHRNRIDTLPTCLRSVWASGLLCPAVQYEIIIADDTDPNQTIFLGRPDVRWYSLRPCHPFNKPRLLNLGIEHAKGDILTFLDADAVVPPRFMENAQRLLDDPTLTKLCYRVKDIEPSEMVGKTTDALFADYDSRNCRYEAYGRPDTNLASRRNPISPKPDAPVFGNSQFSIRRETLGDLRCDEAYCGRGFEDIHFNFQIWRKHFDTYRAEIVTDKDHALLHVKTPQPPKEEEWGTGPWTVANRRRYKKEFDEFRREKMAQGIRV